MKKITLIISSLAAGGAEGVCVNIANGLAESGWGVDLVILHTNNATHLERINKNINLVVLNVNHARHAPIPLLKYIRKERPKIILAFNYELSVLLVILKTMFRFSSKIIARNINTLSKNRQEYTTFWHRFIVKPLINNFYCKVDYIINQCQAMQNDLLKIFPQLINKSCVIYNPVAKYIEEYSIKNDISLVPKHDYLLCVGRLEKQKAFHFAIEAFAKLAKNHTTLRLKIVGQGSLENSLHQLARKLDIDDRIDFEGFQSNMISYYLHAKATVLTSIYEGFPNVLIESITLGTPVIAFDCQSGPNEIIKQGENGFLVKYQSVDNLIESCDNLLNNKINSSQIIESAQMYSSLKILKEYTKVLSLINK